MYKQFQQFLAQTSDFPVGLEVDKAEGIYLYTPDGRQYTDLISGIAVMNVGHTHPEVIAAVKQQSEKYLHVMVYGEYVLAPQVQLAQRMASLLPPSLNRTFFVNSGSEAVEGAIKLAKRYTGRSEIISYNNSYHGSTHGALSLMGNETFKTNYRPLLPEIKFIELNYVDDLVLISDKTAAVILEPIQGEAGVRVADPNYLKKLKQRCLETGTLLLFDEVQTGAGRTGTLFNFEQSGVIPDVLILAKGISGGLPLGAFIARDEIMAVLKNNPVLGHITTFGGNPLSCVASLAVLDILTRGSLLYEVKEKEVLFRSRLQHHKIIEIRGCGLMLALEFGTEKIALDLLHKFFANGLLSDWFLHCSSALRLAPPLTITHEEVDMVCERILECLNDMS